MSDDQLRAWAEAHGTGERVMPQARAVLRLLDHVADLRRQIEGHCGRIAWQAELLSRRAEHPPPSGGQTD